MGSLWWPVTIFNNLAPRELLKKHSYLCVVTIIANHVRARPGGLSSCRVSSDAFAVVLILHALS